MKTVLVVILVTCLLLALLNLEDPNKQYEKDDGR